MTRLLALAWLCLAPAALAARPLTLEEVLAAAEAPHPELDASAAQRELAEAEAALAESLNDLRVTLEGSLRSGRNRYSGSDFEPDNSLRLNLRKTLLDGGRREAGAAAARHEAAARHLQWLDARAQRRIALMSRYFDVLLTDMRYAADNEFMAVAYVNWDNARERLELGQVSAPELAALEAEFQGWRIQRNDAERKARERRAWLASALNRPGELPGELADPRLAANDRPLPGFEPLLARMQAQNPELLAQKQLLAASRHRLEALRADTLPSLEFEAEAASWSREAVTRDDLRAGVNLVWPLYQGRRVDARLAREQARFHLLQAQHERLQLDLRQALYETWQDIQQLRETERRAAEVDAAHRDLALEKARAEYELELKTNLGASMAHTQGAALRRRAVEYRLALAWARLEGLLGGPVEAQAPAQPRAGTDSSLAQGEPGPSSSGGEVK